MWAEMRLSVTNASRPAAESKPCRSGRGNGRLGSPAAGLSKIHKRRAAHPCSGAYSFIRLIRSARSDTGDPHTAPPTAPPGRIRPGTAGRGLPTSSPSANPVGRLEVSVSEEGFSLAGQAAARRHADSLAPRASRAPLPRHRPGGAVVRRALVGRVRDRRNPARPDRRRRRRARARRRPIGARHRDDARDRRLLVPADDPRLSDRRRRLHRRQGEPRRDARAHRGGGAAHRLHPHGRGQHRGRRRGDHVGVSRSCTSTASRCRSVFVAILMIGNLRGIRESGRIFAVPTYFFIVSILALLGARRLARTSPARCSRAGRPIGAAGRRRTLLTTFAAADGVLERLHGDDRRRGGLERRAGVPPAGSEERGGDAGRRWRCWRSRCSSGITLLAHAYHVVPNEHETVVSQLARGDRSAAAAVAVLPGAGGDDADPRARGEHRLRRLPAARVDRRARPLSCRASS